MASTGNRDGAHGCVPGVGFAEDALGGELAGEVFAGAGPGGGLVQVMCQSRLFRAGTSCGAITTWRAHPESASRPASNAQHSHARVTAPTRA
jgi:hypothetical protein